MNRHPIFRRQKWLLPELPEREVKIPATPPSISPPSGSPTGWLWSALPSLATPMLMYFLRPRTSGIGYIGAFLATFVIGLVVNFVRQHQVSKKYERDVRAREEGFHAQLQGCRQELRALSEQQRLALRTADPSPEECLDRIGEEKMWERPPHQSDFLSVRLGIGKVPTSFRATLRTEERPMQQDPLDAAARSLALEYESVDDVPVRLHLRQVGVAGIVGPRAGTIAFARSLAFHIAAHHQPDEVKLAVFFPSREASDWSWLRWLPHVWSDDRQFRFLAADADGARRMLSYLAEIHNRRKEGPVEGPAYVLLIADPTLIENEGTVSMLLKDGPAQQMFSCFLAEKDEEIPEWCHAVITLGGGQSSLVVDAPKRMRGEFRPDDVTVGLAEQAARAMARWRLSNSGEVIPDRVPLLDLYGVNRVEELDALERWHSREPYRSMAVPIGRGPGGKPVWLDLHDHAHGPHGLIAGATGSGKSELLQSLVTSLAISHHPHELVFVMIDFKGGGMADGFTGMPHLVGTLTNLEGNLAARAQEALRAEMNRREELLKLTNRPNANIHDYMRLRRQDATLPALPHLVLIVDEFAELKTQYEHLADDLISAARKGRSLGIHLIIAMQNIGVVKDQMLTNLKFRLCLRMERGADSKTVLGVEDAAFIIEKGRTLLKIGHEPLKRFQGAWATAPYNPDGQREEAQRGEVAEVALDGSRYLLSAVAGPQTRDEHSPAQLSVVVDYLREQARKAGIEPLPSPWQPPLPYQVALDEVRPADTGWNGQVWTGTDQFLQPVVGLVDAPSQQKQEPLKVGLTKGHFGVFGAAGSGKSTLLQTLMTSLMLAHSPRELHVYIVDCAGIGHFMMGGAPHVGAVIYGTDVERVRRLLRFLMSELGERERLFGEAGVNSFLAYQRAARESLPAIVAVFDNYHTWVNALGDIEETLLKIAEKGPGRGIYLALSANASPTKLGRISKDLATVVSLFQNNTTDYEMIVGRGNLGPGMVPGRGLTKQTPPLEFQTALPAGGASEQEWTAQLVALLRRMNQAWGDGLRPRAIRALPDVLPLSELMPRAANSPDGRSGPPWSVPVGVELEDLSPFLIDLQDGPHFLITGPSECGKTTLLQTWALSLAWAVPIEQLDLWIADPAAGRLAPLAELPHTRCYASDAKSVLRMLDDLYREWSQRQQRLEEERATGAFDEQSFISRQRAILLIVDDYDQFRGIAREKWKELDQMARGDRRLKFHLMVAAPVNAFGVGAATDLCRYLKETVRTGFVLGTTDPTELSVLGIGVRTDQAKSFTPGQGTGFYSRRGKFVKVKAASPDAGGDTLVAWVERIGGQADSISLVEK